MWVKNSRRSTKFRHWLKAMRPQSGNSTSKPRRGGTFERRISFASSRNHTPRSETSLKATDAQPRGGERGLLGGWSDQSVAQIVQRPGTGNAAYLPRFGAAFMGTLIKGLGYDHVLWGTDRCSTAPRNGRSRHSVVWKSPTTCRKVRLRPTGCCGRTGEKCDPWLQRRNAAYGYVVKTG